MCIHRYCICSKGFCLRIGLDHLNLDSMLVVAIKILQTGTNKRPFTIYKGDYQFKCVKMLSLYLQFMTSAKITKNKNIICTVTKTRRKNTEYK